MSLRFVVGLLGGLSCVVVTTTSWAQCSKDTDCKGERVCEEGACVAPAPGTATAPATTQPAPVAPPAAAPAPSISAPAPSAAAPRSTEVVDKRRPRHSTGMMAGGIVMVSFVPVALLAAWIADIGQTVCEADYSYSSGTTVRRTDCDRFDPTIYGGLISAAVLAGVGIPLIVIGGKREPLGSAKLTPWATPQAGGLSFKLEM